MGHLVARLLRSLRPRSPGPADDAWAVERLTPGEQVLYRAMPAVDRRHGVDGGRVVADRLGEDRRDSIEAALVHDVGKRHAGLGVLGRSVATAVGWFVRDESARERWGTTRGWRGRVGRYLRHDAVGAEEIAAVGGSPLAVAWARDHHHPDRFPSLPAPPAVLAALAAADHDT